MKNLICNYIYEDVKEYFLNNRFLFENKLKIYIDEKYIGKKYFILIFQHKIHYIYIKSENYIDNCIKLFNNIYGLRYIDFDINCKELKIYTQ